jgi:hypothetical protein
VVIWNKIVTKAWSYTMIIVGLILGSSTDGLPRKVKVSFGAVFSVFSKETDWAGSILSYCLDWVNLSS